MKKYRAAIAGTAFASLCLVLLPGQMTQAAIQLRDQSPAKIEVAAQARETDDTRRTDPARKGQARSAAKPRSPKVGTWTSNDFGCGTQIPDDINRVTFTQDLDCSAFGDSGGLVVDERHNQSTLVIDLNGHKVFTNRGAGTGLGVYHSENVTITGPGEVRDFSDGIRCYFSSRCTVTGVSVFDSTDDGIQFWFADNGMIRGNDVHHATDAGISVYGHDTKIVVRNNTVNGADDNGGNIRGNKLIEIVHNTGPNTIMSNTLRNIPNNGIEIRGGSNNTITKNVIENAQHYGITFLKNNPIDGETNDDIFGATDNKVVSNTIIGKSGANGIVTNDQSGNIIQKNRVSGNSTDLVESNSSCVNSWKSNKFGSKNRSCID